MTGEPDRSVAGSADEWMLFERMTPDNYPLVVLARVGNSLVEHSLAAAHLTIVRCDAEAELVNDSGMPQQTDRLYALEDDLAEELTKLDAGAFHIASITGEGLRQIIYGHYSLVDFLEILKSFDIAGYSLSANTEVDRAALIQLVVPNELDRQLNGDQRVIANLEQHGDDVNAPRKTDFWFYGPVSALSMVAAELSPWGLSIDHWVDDPEGVVLTAHVPVGFQAFRELTPILLASAQRHGATYDGWETFVINTELEKSNRPEPKTPSLLSKLFGAKKN